MNQWLKEQCVTWVTDKQYLRFTHSLNSLKPLFSDIIHFVVVQIIGAIFLLERQFDTFAFALHGILFLSHPLCFNFTPIHSAKLSENSTKLKPYKYMTGNAFSVGDPVTDAKSFAGGLLCSSENTALAIYIMWKKNPCIAWQCILLTPVWLFVC